MNLFQVDGWDLKEKKIAFGGASTKPSKKSKKRARKEEHLKKRSLRDEIEKEMQETEFDEGDEDEEEEEEKPVERSVKKAKIEGEKQQKKNDVDGVKKGETKKTDTLKKADTLKKTDTSKKESAPAAAVAVPAPAPAMKLTPLQQKMMNKLSGSRFRWINEQLYTITSQDALSLIKDQPSLFDEYHDGFRSQVQSWPENPVDVFVEQIKTRARTRVVNAPGGLPGLGANKKVVIADMGCGEANLSLQVSQFLTAHNKKAGKNPRKRLDVQVHSFDLKKVNNRITVADIKNVPLPDESCTIVVFCLALMGTNFLDFIKEAYRILAPRGELWIAEIKSRFSDSNSTKKDAQVGTEFVDALKLCGFFHKKTDNENKMFTRFEFFKPPPDIIQERKEKLERRQKFVEVESEREQLEEKRNKRPEGEWLLKPCIYKRR
ncbi:25S rRNA (adenine(645)-N(1))-methyltransferase [[Candida] anglica]|uniref:Ribosomal RNA-processing protein 8 n=1 Tax=[Candida] anglica TaxID=148631 RepID=A0ABP0EHN7_9ASCO